ncbi:hypothetical protein [Lacipirellula parvula]|uniref:Uncharacterized protein n=1 Tax=Lacipirellula parvula TaxID=2650471 RepID=A0A5K7XKL8_9BACT|nr:hypothetical protein [Lacipirellula parvula]BBO34853.1 hypothetical protein PLANPX_4465 [Lacipirellula parvula]
MIRRRTSEAGGGVLSFTFLDVLTCTMGSLVLLLVVLAQRATNVTLEEALANAKKPHAASNGTESKPPAAVADEKSPEQGEQLAESDAAEPAAKVAQEHKPAVEVKDGIKPEELEKELAELREQMPKLEKLRADAAQRVKDEEDRVSHLEEHERRLELELAKLRLALQHLEEAEKKQSVDQESAETNLKRLKQLVADTEKEIEKLRKESTGKKSYAIVPYQGANGTMRRPIYIECTKDAVTIYPEGIRLTAADFDGPLRSGNPLAAAIRAAREELNARAAAAGMTDLPDPYPLIIVRPDGAYAYSAALSAISSWDADFGYEFVDEDWKLEYPDPDARLDQIMRHAVEQARQRQAMLAKAAPRQYGSRLALGSGEGGGGDGSGGMGGGFEGVAHPGGDGDRIGDHSGENWMQAGGGQDSGAGSGTGTGAQAGGGRYAETGAAGMSTSGQGGTGGGAAGNSSGQPGPAGTGANGQNGQTAAAGQQQAGGNTMAGTGGAAGSAGPAGTQPGQGVAGGTEASGSTTPTGGSTFAGSSTPTGAAAGQAGASGGAASSNATASNGAAGSAGGSDASNGSSGGASSGSAGSGAQGGASGGVVSYTAGQTASAAGARGANWANEAASRRASAISRPIRVVVKTEQIDVMPANQGGSGPAEQPMAISFHQPTDRVLDQLAASVKERMADWGQAGNNMYWRPTLLLQVEPGAEQHAIRLNDLLRDSGIDVKFQEVAARTEEGAGSGTTR